MTPARRKFLTSFAFVCAVFLSGGVFGYGLRTEFAKKSIIAAYSMGRESVVLEVLQDGKIMELADAR